MKKLICIPFLLLSLTCSAQKFDEMLTIGDTLEDGRIILETKYVGKFTDKIDTISIELYMNYEPKTETVIIEGIFIFDASHGINYQFMFENGSAIFNLYDKESPNFYTTKNVTVGNISENLMSIRKNGIVLLPIDGSEDYIKTYTTGFKKIKCEWF